ncbi:MAG: prepilin-type N-terminal cleavage/methylation domain-containing protein [Patescibacteria group bacterium]
MRNPNAQSGFTVIEVLIGLAILTIVSTSIYFSYANVLEIVQTAQYNNAALSIMESRIETARNMRYEDVGVIGGVPAGKLNQVETVTLGSVPFTLHAYVRNIDDPFDGTIGGTPNDTAPADYKLVEFQLTCDTCTRYKLLTMVTYVAPKNLETASRNGNLFIRVLNASGIPVSGATVHVTNTHVNPHVDLTDITNNAGLLQLVDIATSSAGYHITVSKAGYSNDQTYPPGNPVNPLKPDATVANQQLTIATLAIDRVGTLTVRARTQFCAPVTGFDFLMTGGKLIGTQPDVPKYSSSLVTDTDGYFINSGVEWDTYAIRPTDTVDDIAGTISSLSFTMDPDMTRTMVWQIASRSQDGLSVSVTDQNSLPLDGAQVQMTGTGYDRTQTTGSWTLEQSDWSSGQYVDKSSFLDTSVSGQLTLMLSNGSYASAGQEWLISESYDLGTSSTNFTTLNWAPASQPPQTGPDSLQFQLATNNDNTTWSWVGPDGTPSSFFTAPGQAIPATLASNRYLRYRAYLSTADDTVTPTLQDVAIGFSSGCVLSGQAYFNGLGAGSYTATITLAGYQAIISTINISDTWQRASIQLSP